MTNFHIPTTAGWREWNNRSSTCCVCWPQGPKISVEEHQSMLMLVLLCFLCRGRHTASRRWSCPGIWSVCIKWVHLRQVIWLAGFQVFDRIVDTLVLFCWSNFLVWVSQWVGVSGRECRKGEAEDAVWKTWGGGGGKSLQTFLSTLRWRWGICLLSTKRNGNWFSRNLSTVQ